MKTPNRLFKALRCLPAAEANQTSVRHDLEGAQPNHQEHSELADPASTMGQRVAVGGCCLDTGSWPEAAFKRRRHLSKALGLAPVCHSLAHCGPWWIDHSGAAFALMSATAW
jgi:hypothetical protein